MKQLKGFSENHGKKMAQDRAALKCGITGRFKTGQYLTPPGHSGFKQVVRQYKIGASQRGIDFLLSESDMKRLTQSNCFYCNAVPAREAFCTKQRTREAAERSKYIYNGIDRVDSSKPYILENCVPCCRVCNLAKNNLSFEEFTAYLDNLISNYGGVPYRP